DPSIETSEARIVGLSANISAEDLLNDDGDLEEGEDLEEPDARNVTAAAACVPRDDLVTAEPARRPGDGRLHVVIVGRLAARPVGEQEAHVHHRLVEPGSFPVENRSE